jgi:hypothetical protein
VQTRRNKKVPTIVLDSQPTNLEENGLYPPLGSALNRLNLAIESEYQ